MERVKIVWSGPYSVDSAVEKFRNYDDFGIYMITRKWGEIEKLLYIGRVYWRSFANRIAEHKRDWLSNLRGEIRVRIGKIKLGRGKIHSFERTDDIEKLLILAHEPEENYQSTLTCDVRDLKITNLGRKGPLLHEVCTEDFEKLN